MRRKWIWILIFGLIFAGVAMNADDILNNTDPRELRNILRRLKLHADAVQRPVPNVIINQAPQQFPPSSTTVVNSNLGWINVKDYGAVGDGSANDTAAINTAINALNTAGAGVLYFPPGHYQTTGALTAITANAWILGDGSAAFGGDDAVSEVLCSSATANLFTINSDRALIQNIAVKNNAVSTPSAGAGILVTSSNIAQRVDYERVSAYGFYINIDVQVGADWNMHAAFIIAPVLYGIKIRNTVNPDAGDWAISDSTIIARLYNSTAGIRIESSGGGKINNSKINGNAPGDGKRFTHGIDIAGSNNTSILLIANNSIENITTNGIHGTGGWNYISIVNNQIGLYTSNNTSAISLSNMNYFHIIGGQFIYIIPGSSSAAAIALSNCSYGYIAGITQRNFSATVSQSSCTNITEVDTASSVVTETSYGQASAVGTSTYYARQDHTHGTPGLSSSTPADVGSSGAAGSGSSPSKSDHSHKGVHSIAKNGSSALYGDVTLSAGENVTLTQAGQNIEISASASSGSGAGQVTGAARWSSSGGATYELPDVAEYLLNAFDNGSLVDPLTYSLSADRTQLVFDSAIISGHVVAANYVVAQV